MDYTITKKDNQIILNVAYHGKTVLRVQLADWSAEGLKIYATTLNQKENQCIDDFIPKNNN